MHYYTLSKLMSNNIDNVNAFLKKIISSVLDNLESEVGLQEIIRNSYEFIEKNRNKFQNT